MSKKVVIGLVGPKTCGKSTVVNILCEFYPVQESALANKLKNVLCEVFDLKREQVDRQDLKELAFEAPKEITTEALSKILDEFGIDASSHKDPTLMQTYLDFFKPLIGKEIRSPREAAQIVGTEILRSIDPDIHCKGVTIFDNSFTVVSDIRFFNEYLYFSSIGDVTFVPLYIQRDSAEQEVTNDSHISERDFLRFRDKCIKINNNGTLADTESQVKRSVDRVLYGEKNG